jgi:hypothetical protein
MRAIHGAFITLCFFQWILGKSYSSVISLFSYFYENKGDLNDDFNKNKYLLEEKDDFLFVSFD